MKTNGMTMLAAAMALAAHGAGQKTVHNLDAFPLVCERVAAVEGREPSLLPKGVKLGLVWNDEFDGNSLDESKWSYRNDHMTGKGVPELEAVAKAGDEFLVDYVRVYDIEETE